jgi:hypothetical protein
MTSSTTINTNNKTTLSDLQQLKPISSTEASNLLEYVFCGGGVGPSLSSSSSPSSTTPASSSTTTEKSLSGRQVLIPFGRRAFLEGELCPSSSSPKSKSNEHSHNSNDQDETQEKEMIDVLQDDLTWSSMSTDEARTFLQHKVASSKSSTSSTRTPSTATANKSPAPTSKSSSSSKASTTSMSSMNNSQSETSQPSSQTEFSQSFFMGLPSNLMDIQEEYDSQGNQIYAKAVDVTSQLKSFWKNSKDENKDNGGSATDDDKMDELSQPSPGIVTAAETESETETSSSPSSKPTVVSDEEYDRLSRRLEELAQLEEEEAAAAAKGIKRIKNMKKGVNDKNNSAAKTKPKTTTRSNLQFKKGFLNSNSKSSNASKSNNKNNVKQKQVSSSSSPPAGQQQETENNGHDHDDSGDGRRKNKTITIDTTKNMVQEIPSEVPNPQIIPSKQHTSNLLNKSRGGHVGGRSTQLDESIFNGRIQEQEQQRRQQQPNASGPQHINQPPPQHKKEKKMSRFALERLQQQQQE